MILHRKPVLTLYVCRFSPSELWNVIIFLLIYIHLFILQMIIIVYCITYSGISSFRVVSLFSFVAEVPENPSSSSIAASITFLIVFSHSQFVGFVGGTTEVNTSRSRSPPSRLYLIKLLIYHDQEKVIPRYNIISKLEIDVSSAMSG